MLYFSIVLNVRLIRGLLSIFVGGKRCSQCVCEVPFITSKLPCSRTSETFVFSTLCLNENFLSAPKDNDAIAPFFFRSFSPSLCHAIPSSPLWY